MSNIFLNDFLMFSLSYILASIFFCLNQRCWCRQGPKPCTAGNDIESAELGLYFKAMTSSIEINVSMNEYLSYLFVQVLQNDLHNSIRWDYAILLVNRRMVFLFKQPVSHGSLLSHKFLSQSDSAHTLANDYFKKKGDRERLSTNRNHLGKQHALQDIAYP